MSFNPFPGLRPFEQHEAHLFFGRDGQSETLLQRLTKTRFLAVVGTSGSGKSSLVRAGFLPALHGGYRELGQWSWRMGIVRPGMDPIGNLARTLLNPGTLNDEALEPGTQWTPDPLEVGMMETVLRRGSQGLIEAIQEARLPTHERFVLLVDQFEELFTYQEERKDAAAREDAAVFVRLLLESTREKSSPIFVVITMRSDYLGDCAQFRDLPEALNEGQYLIPRMTREERQQAIEGPAAVGNGVFAPQLVQRVLNDVGDDPDQLPILQHALMCTWDQWAKEASNSQTIQLEQYETIGGFEKALDQHANGAYDSLPNDRAKKLAEKLFKFLTKKDVENRGVRRPLSINTIAKIAGVHPQDLDPIIKVFQSGHRNFLVETGESPEDGSPVIDISHESFIRNWQKLAGDGTEVHKGWLTEESEARGMYLRLVESAERYGKKEGGAWRNPELSLAVKWRETSKPNETWASLYGGDFHQAMQFLKLSQREEWAEQRKKQWVVRGIVTLILAVIGALGWGFYTQKQLFTEVAAQKDKAEHALVKVEQQREEAVEAKKLAETEKQRATQALAAVKEAKKIAEAERDKAEASAKEAAEAREGETLQAKIAQQRALEKEQVALKAKAATAVIASSSQLEAGKPTLAALLVAQMVEAPEPYGGLVYAYELASSSFSQSVLKGHTSAVNYATFSPDGTRVVTASDDGTARAWPADGTGEAVVLTGHTSFVSHAAFSPDGSRVVTASYDGTGRVWPADGTGEAVVLTGHTSFVSHAAFSPDGTRVVTASGDGTGRVWPADGTGEAVVLTGHTSAVNYAAFSPDGTRVVTASGDGTARVWPADGTGEAVVLTGHINTRPVYYATFSPDGTRVVTASGDGTGRVWPADGTGEAVVLTGHTSAVYYAAFSPDGTRVVTASGDGTARVWFADGTGEAVVLTGHTSAVNYAAFSPDGSRVVTTSHDGTGRVWPADGTGEAVVLTGHTRPVYYAAFSPDGSRVVTASGDGTARAWFADGMGEPVVLTGHTRPVYYAAFSPDGTRVVTASHDATGRVWPADGTGKAVVLTGHTSAVNYAAFSPDGTRVVTASHDGTGRVWPADGTGKAVVLTGHTSAVYYAAFSPDGTRVVTTSHDATGRVWPADGTGKAVVLTGHTSAVNYAAFSPDGTQVVTASHDGTGRVWPADGTGEPVVLTGHTSAVNYAAFSPDGSRVVTTSHDGTGRVWPADGTGKAVVLTGHTRPVYYAAFSPDGSRVVTASGDGTGRVWPADGTGKAVVLTGHTSAVYYAAFSPDGSRVVTASGDGTGRVWPADGTGEPVVLTGHTSDVNYAAFSPDGSRVVTASHDGTARVWRVKWKTLLTHLRESTTACLSVKDRLRYLAEEELDAQIAYETCERRYRRVP